MEFNHKWEKLPNRKDIYCEKCGVSPHEKGASIECPVEDPDDRLYIVTRSDLSTGMKMAQCCHVALVASQRLQFRKTDWDTIHPFLIVLEVPGRVELEDLEKDIPITETDYVKFSEPDLENEITAIAFLSNKVTKGITKRLELVK